MRPYIISVDDEDDVTDLIAFNLRRENYEVATASTGHSALDLIQARRPDLLLLDLMLPDLDGVNQTPKTSVSNSESSIF